MRVALLTAAGGCRRRSRRSGRRRQRRRTRRAKATTRTAAHETSCDRAGAYRRPDAGQASFKWRMRGGWGGLWRRKCAAGERSGRLYAQRLGCYATNQGDGCWSGGMQTNSKSSLCANGDLSHMQALRHTYSTVNQYELRNVKGLPSASSCPAQTHPRWRVHSLAHHRSWRRPGAALAAATRPAPRRSASCRACPAAA